jgi:hypothetical protein
MQIGRQAYRVLEYRDFNSSNYNCDLFQMFTRLRMSQRVTNVYNQIEFIFSPILPLIPSIEF